MITEEHEKFLEKRSKMYAKGDNQCEFNLTINGHSESVSNGLPSVDNGSVSEE